MIEHIGLLYSGAGLNRDQSGPNKVFPKSVIAKSNMANVCKYTEYQAIFVLLNIHGV